MFTYEVKVKQKSFLQRGTITVVENIEISIKIYKNK